MDYNIAHLFKDRKARNKCVVCGKDITFEMECFRDYMPMIHPDIGKVLVETRHLIQKKEV